MSRFCKSVALAIASLSFLAVTAETASAQYYRYGPHPRPYYRSYNPGVGIAAGVLGGLAAGAIIAGATRPAYAAPVYGAPVYVDEPECFRRRVGWDAWGRPIFRVYCQ